MFETPKKEQEVISSPHSCDKKADASFVSDVEDDSSGDEKELGK